MSMFDDVLGLGRTSSITEGVTEFEPEIEECTLENVEALPEDIDLDEFIMEAAFNNERNMMAIDRAIMCEEYVYLRENGKELVYEEGRISNILDTAKQAVIRVWNNIQKYLASITKAIRDTEYDIFKEKYSKLVNGKSVKIKGDKKLLYTTTSISNGIMKVLRDIGKIGNEWYTGEDPDKYIKDKLGLKDNDTIDSLIGVVPKSKFSDVTVTAQDAFNTLSAYSNAKASIKDLFKADKKIIDDEIKSIKKSSKRKDRSEDDAKNIHTGVKTLNILNKYLVAANRSAIKYINQGRAMAKAAIIAMAKEANGSSTPAGESTVSFLDNVELV